MTNAEARFNNSLRPRKPQGSLGRTAQDGHLDSHTAPELCGHLLGRERVNTASLRLPPPTHPPSPHYHHPISVSRRAASLTPATRAQLAPLVSRRALLEQYSECLEDLHFVLQIARRALKCFRSLNIAGCLLGAPRQTRLTESGTRHELGFYTTSSHLRQIRMIRGHGAELFCECLLLRFRPPFAGACV